MRKRQPFFLKEDGLFFFFWLKIKEDGPDQEKLGGLIYPKKKSRYSDY